MVACFDTVEQRSPKSEPRARSGPQRFQSGSQTFLEMFSVLTISCKWINARCNYTKRLESKKHLL